MSDKYFMSVIFCNDDEPERGDEGDLTKKMNGGW